MSSDDATPTVPGLFASRAAESRFPSHLPAPGAGGGSELGEMVQYSTDAAPAPFPAPNPGPAGVPPVVTSWPGSWVGWLLRGRRGKDGDSAA